MNARTYGALITKAMRRAGIMRAIDAPEPPLFRFSIQARGQTFDCEIDLSRRQTKAERLKLAFECQQDLVARILAVPVPEKQVSCCSTCRTWFPSVEARNQHRLTEHQPMAEA